MADSKPTNEVFKLKQHILNYNLLKNLKQYSGLFSFWLDIFA